MGTIIHTFLYLSTPVRMPCQSILPTLSIHAHTDRLRNGYYYTTSHSFVNYPTPNFYKSLQLKSPEKFSRFGKTFDLAQQPCNPLFTPFSAIFGGVLKTLYSKQTNPTQRPIYFPHYQVFYFLQLHLKTSCLYSSIPLFSLVLLFLPQCCRLFLVPQVFRPLHSTPLYPLTL